MCGRRAHLRRAANGELLYRFLIRNFDARRSAREIPSTLDKLPHFVEYDSDRVVCRQHDRNRIPANTTAPKRTRLEYIEKKSLTPEEGRTPKGLLADWQIRKDIKIVHWRGIFPTRRRLLRRL